MPLPDHLPGEPRRPTLSPLATAAHLLGSLGALLILLLLGAPLWALYLPLRLFVRRPPTVLDPRRLGRMLRAAAAAPLGPTARLGIALDLGARAALGPFFGLAWLLDEALYGRALDATPLRAPLIELSAARSGSTQLAHYIEDDPQIAAPSTLFTLLPYRWLWRALPARALDAIGARFAASLPPQYLERHEFDLHRTDTFEVLFGLFQAADLAICLGPAFFLAEMGTARRSPTNAPFYEGELLPFFDRVARKTLLDQPGKRLLIKGHFLPLAPALQAAYPDARFLVVLRAPEARIASTINFHRCHPVAPLVGALPWDWLVDLALAMEVDYCEAELDWIATPGHRCVIRFADYVADLPGTLHKVYADCFDAADLPPHLPTAHAPRVRTAYSVDRSLDALGIDRAALRARLGPAIAAATPHAKGA